MKELWAPWRSEYFKIPKDKGCFLCKSFASRNDRANHVVKRGKTCAVVLNRYPYTGGHLMVCPYRHVSQFDDLSHEEMMEMMDLTRQAIKALRRTIKPSGFNIGINIGEAAGAGLKDHIHLHVVPRWAGDTNFITVMADVRVVPQSLLDLWDILHHAMNRSRPDLRSGKKRPRV
jgi:ATP adenylyltransferase